VRSLDISNDGRSLLSASADGTVKFWDMQKPQPLRDAGLHGGAASAVRFLPGGDRFVSAGGDGQVVVRAIEDGEVLHRFDGRAHGHVATLALSADGQRALAAYEKNALVVWDLQSKAMVKTLKDLQFYAVDISPDGRQAVIGTYEGKLFVWDIDGDASPREIGTQQGGVFAIAVTPDGKHFIAGGGGDCVLRLRDIATGDEVRAFAFHNAPITRLAVSADGKHVISGSLDKTSRVWDVETGKPVTTLDQSNVVRAVAFAADGAFLTAGDDRTIRLWSRRGFREREFPGVNGN
jgi:WD40 repeat protein